MGEVEKINPASKYLKARTRNILWIFVIFLYPIALILPIYMAARYSFHGIVIGGLIIWSLVRAAILVDTQSLGLGWPFLILWIAFGLPVGMLYSATTSAFIMLIWRMLIGKGS